MLITVCVVMLETFKLHTKKNWTNFPIIPMCILYSFKYPYCGASPSETHFNWLYILTMYSYMALLGRLGIYIFKKKKLQI